MAIQATKLQLSKIILENEKTDFWDELSISEQKEIKKGIKDLDNGKRISYESFLEKISLDMLWNFFFVTVEGPPERIIPLTLL